LIRLAFAVEAPLVARFFLLLQQGVLIRRRVGCPVESFLRQELGAAPETVEMIQSVMLDGKPVDDIGAAFIRDGSTLALSAAMPGVVGATMRRGGAYASMRSAITYHETGGTGAAGEGWVTIKLFNLLMAELGPSLLRGEVLVASSALLDLLTELPEHFWRGCRRVTRDGTAVNRDLLFDAVRLGGATAVLLSVFPEPAGVDCRS
jgi:hypothetical protein